MGLYDTLRVNDPRFLCSEGHDLSDEEFQSKDFGCTMGLVLIENGRLSIQEGYVGTPEADSTKVEIYCTCRQCPAFVQYGTGNLVDCGVTFDVELAGDTVTKITRVGETTIEWLAAEPLKRHMARSEGPMAYEEARKIHVGYRGLRPEASDEFQRWSMARAQALQAGRPWSWDLAIGEYPDSAEGAS